MTRQTRGGLGLGGHRDVGGDLLLWVHILANLSDGALGELGRMCHSEPAEPNTCVLCAAHVEYCQRRAQSPLKNPRSWEVKT